MAGLRFRRPSPALVVGVIALVAAASGAAIALPGVNSVDSGDIKNGQVKRPDLRNNAINSPKVANGSLLAVDFAAGQIPAGPTGAAGATGATGAAGATGPSVVHQNFVLGNLAITGTTQGTENTITSLTLPGPASYLVQATGSVFGSGLAPNTSLDTSFRLTKDGVQVGGGNYEVGASFITSHVPATYSVLRLITVPDASDVVNVRAHKLSGSAGTPTVFVNTLTATLVGTAIGAQSPEELPASGSVGSGG